MGKKGKKKGFIIAGTVVLLLCIVLGVYHINRRTHLGNDDLLLTYESREPVKVVEETVDGIPYTDYIFDVGRVIV